MSVEVTDSIQHPKRKFVELIRESDETGLVTMTQGNVSARCTEFPDKQFIVEP